MKVPSRSQTLTARVETYEYVGGNSAKFWEAVYVNHPQHGNIALTRWGRIGAVGQSQWTELRVAEDREVEKERKGYDHVGSRAITVDADYVTPYSDSKPFANHVHNILSGRITVAPNSEPVSNVLTDRDDPKHSTPVEDPLRNLATRASAALSMAAIHPQEAMVEYAHITEEIGEHRDALRQAESNLRTLELMLGLDEGDDA